MVRSILTGYDLLLNWIVDPALESFTDHLFRIVQSSGGTLTAKVTPETLARIFRELSHEFSLSSENLVAAHSNKARLLRQVLTVGADRPTESSSQDDDLLAEDELITIEIRYANQHEIPIVCFNVEKYRALAQSASLSIDIWNVVDLRRTHETYLQLRDLVHPVPPPLPEFNGLEEQVAEETLPVVDAIDAIYFADTIDALEVSNVPDSATARSRAENSTQTDERSPQVRNMSQEGRVEPTPRRFDTGPDLVQLLFVLMTQVLLTYWLQQIQKNGWTEAELAGLDSLLTQSISDWLKGLNSTPDAGVQPDSSPLIATSKLYSQENITLGTELAAGFDRTSITASPHHSALTSQAADLTLPSSGSEFVTVELVDSSRNQNQPNSLSQSGNEGADRPTSQIAVIASQQQSLQPNLPSTLIQSNQVRQVDNPTGSNGQQVKLPEVVLVKARPFDPTVIKSSQQDGPNPEPPEGPGQEPPLLDPNHPDKEIKEIEDFGPPTFFPLPAFPQDDQTTDQPDQVDQPDNEFSPVPDLTPNPKPDPTPTEPGPIPMEPAPAPRPIDQSDSINLPNPAGVTLINIGEKGNYVIDNFGGIGRGVNPSQLILDNLDTLKFAGEGLTAENLLLEQQGNDLLISFAIADSPKVTLKNFVLDHLDNLSTATWASVTNGNILFNGQDSIADTFDVINAELQLDRVIRPNTVTFLNSLDNSISGYEQSSDTINGMDGNDQILGLSGNDILRGGTGDDELAGGEGDDALVGETGNDTLIGGAGNDRFVFSLDSGSATILDFQLGLDRLELEGDIQLDQISTQIVGNDTVLLFNDQPFATLLGVQANVALLFGTQSVSDI